MARSKPNPKAATPPAPGGRRNGMLLVVVVVAVLAAGGLLASGRTGRLEVTVVNQSGEAFNELRVGDGPDAVTPGRLADGQTLRASVPLADAVTIRLTPAKGRPVRGIYHFENRSGLSHALQVTLLPRLPEAGDTPRVGRTWDSSSSALMGHEVRFREPIDQLEPEPEAGAGAPSS